METHGVVCHRVAVDGVPLRDLMDEELVKLGPQEPGLLTQGGNVPARDRPGPALGERHRDPAAAGRDIVAVDAQGRPVVLDREYITSYLRVRLGLVRRRQWMK